MQRYNLIFSNQNPLINVIELEFELVVADYAQF